MITYLFSDGAAWFSVPAFVGTLLFLVQMSGLTGGQDGDGSAGHSGGHTGGDSGHGDPNGPEGHGNPFAGVLSVQSCAAFAMGFGLGGLSALRGSDWGMGISIGVGVACGVAFVALLGLLFRQARRLNSSGNIGIGQLVGCEADVTVRIPAAGQGKGEIRAVVGDRERRCAATSSGEAIASRTHVVVERVNGDNSVLVRLPSGGAQQT